MSTQPPLCSKSGGMLTLPVLSLRWRISTSRIVDCSGELVNAVVGFGKSLVGDHCLSAYCGDEAVCDGTCGVIEIVAILHMEDGLSQAGGDRGVVSNAVRGNVYVERGW